MAILRPSAVGSLSTVSLLGCRNERELAGRGQSPILVLLFVGTPPQKQGQVVAETRCKPQGWAGWGRRGPGGKLVPFQAEMET